MHHFDVSRKSLFAYKVFIYAYASFYNHCQEAKNGSYEPSLIIDGANGVGANVCATMLERLGGVLSATLVNVGAPGILNHEVTRHLKTLAVFINYS